VADIGVSVPFPELIKLCAVNTDLFARTFFPQTMRDPSPEFDEDVWKALEDPRKRLVNLEMWRGSGKTSKLRIFTAKRLAYAISRTILYVGSNESAATRSIQWLRSAIEPKMGADGKVRPPLFAQVFGLEIAKKGEEQLQLVQRIPGMAEKTAWILGAGITGTVRGINFEDYRPDLIVLDDIMTDENSQTEEQCNKITNLVMGALVNSLAPETEEPNAKLAHLCTPLDPRDVSAQAKQSPAWHTESFGCWTKDTEDFDVGEQESSWETRYPTAKLRQDKLNALATNKYSIFAREMECKLISSEKAAFKPNWLKFYDNAPKGSTNVLAIDPTPPPSERQKENLFRDKDYEALAVVGRVRGDYYLLDYQQSRGHEPNWTIHKIFELALRWRVQRIVVESIAYQRMLKWLLEKEMQRRGVYYIVKDTKVGGKSDRRSKFTRITDALSGVASNGHFFVKPEHSEFILQFQSYGSGYRGSDDLLEAGAIATGELTNPYLELGVDDYEELDASIEDFPMVRVCP
jgi:hypothetical protein